MSAAAVRAGLVKVDDIVFHPHNVRHDPGDLRSLVAGIQRFGIMQPVVLEERGDCLRLRAGHRRVAAARLAGLARVPAVIHATALDDDEWLLAAVHENAQRRNLDAVERRRAIVALRETGCSWSGIAEAFGVTESTARVWANNEGGATPRVERTAALTEKVAQLTTGGRSASQIADSLGISAREVARLRTGNVAKPVSRSVLRGFIAHWSQYPSAPVTDVLDALARLTMPHPTAAPANERNQR